MAIGIDGVFTLLFRHRTQIDSLVLDASVSEQHDGDVDVTEHNVEVGANISDHARVKPETLTIEGIITATPFGKDPSLDYIDEAYAKLRELKDTHELITVITPIRLYKNMIVTKLSVPRSIQTGDALRFNISFKEIRLATVTVVDRVVPKIKKANGTTDKGKQVAAPADLTERSLAANLDDASGGTVSDTLSGQSTDHSLKNGLGRMVKGTKP